MRTQSRGSLKLMIENDHLIQGMVTQVQRERFVQPQVGPHQWAEETFGVLPRHFVCQHHLYSKFVTELFFVVRDVFLSGNQREILAKFKMPFTFERARENKLYLRFFRKTSQHRLATCQVAKMETRVSSRTIAKLSRCSIYIPIP